MKQLLGIVLILFTATTFSQINFETGYFISPDGERVNCLIKNYDWLNNPTEITYKFSQMGPEKTIGLEEFIAFGIDNGATFEKYTVQIDRSPAAISNLVAERYPVFNEETLMLKKLVVGTASLYGYTDQSLIRFFYSMDDGAVQQLVWKKYRISGTKIGENNQFRQELFNAFQCESISQAVFEKVRYQERELIDLFNDYNACINGTVDADPSAISESKKDLFNLVLKGGIRNNNLTVDLDPVTNRQNVKEFPSETSVQFGIETEFIFNFNKNKWSALLEAYYYQYNTTFRDSRVIIPDIVTTLNTYELKYAAIEFIVGGRYSMFVGDQSRIYIMAGLATSLPTENDFLFQGESRDEAVVTSNASFGVGFNYGRFYAEGKLGLNKPLLDSRTSEYNSFSFLLGYSFF